MTTLNQTILNAANGHVGTQEWPGARHNPEVLEYYAAAGHPEVQNDEVPWCAAFVGAVLAQVGLPNTGSLLARSYSSWGEAVDIGDAQPGDVVVLSRGQPWQGHVGFLHSMTGTGVTLIGGNQGNEVSIQTFAKARVVAVRRARARRESIAGSGTVQGIAGTAITGAAGTVTAVSQLEGNSQIAVIVLAGAAALILLWMFRRRLREWAAGDR